MSTWVERRVDAAVLRCVAAALVCAVGAGPLAGCASAAPGRRAGVPDADLAARVERVLAGQAGIPGGAIAVAADGGVVTLSGRLRDHVQLQDLGAVVRAIPGVRLVKFAVALGPAPGSAGQARAGRRAEAFLMR